MPLTILTGREASEIARRHNPVVVQYTTGNDPRDNIEPFYSGPFDGGLSPVAYYAVKRDDKRGYTCVWYHWYHRMDFGPVNIPLDRHDGDFEGVCFCIPDDDRGELYRLYRNHHHIILVYGRKVIAPTYVCIESKGHGVFPSRPLWYQDSCRVYVNLPLAPLYAETGEDSPAARLMRAKFAEWGTVDWMDQYEDMRLKGKRIEHKGDYWNDPLGLVAKMEKQYP